MCSLHEPAPPLLGSILLANEETLGGSRPSPLSSGLDTVDREALDGGLRYGEITSIAGASGTGKTLLAYQIIASHLIARKEGEVALIATTDPPLARLRDVLLNRLARQKQGPDFRQSGYVYRKETRTEDPSQSVQILVSSMLERVRLSRVFDFPGVAEAIGEFSARLDNEETSRRDEAPKDEEGYERAPGTANDEDKAESSSPSPTERMTTSSAEASRHSPASMVVIDNIANVVGAMTTKSQAQGQALLATCMRSLQHLTRRRNVCTVIVNAAVGLRRQSTEYHRKSDDQASIFSSILGKPALGKHFSFLTDTSILLSTLPRSREDADIAYNAGQTGNEFTKVGIIEVVKDKHGSREGRWSSFMTVAGIELRNVQ